MSKLLTHCVVLLLLFSQWPLRTDCLIDPISLGVGAGIGVAASSYKYLVENSYCRITECCNEQSIPADIDGLEAKLKSSLFGQHIVIHQLIPALRAHFDPHVKPRKPLVISFHGPTGTGKNFVIEHITEALYARGLESKHVHIYNGRMHFPLEKDAKVYKDQIHQDVRGALASCPRSLFIFNEVDKMPAGIFDSLTSLIDYNPRKQAPENAEKIFIFVSNLAGVEISKHLGNLIKNGTAREQTKLSDFEQTLKEFAFNEKGGLNKASLIEAHLIDHFIPFLPLEKQHVQKCIVAEFQKWHRQPKDDEIDAVINEAVTYDRTHGLFVTSGCKTIEKKVAVKVQTIGT